ncbi:hypothetical protein WMY93_033952 [Mugilogobius chulae]|uniref:Uncharacterized protein n=1 Tax=Mugilogobius chulae TaxID=88201 RepID=A0AAW0MHA8_9GOBI
MCLTPEASRALENKTQDSLSLPCGRSSVAENNAPPTGTGASQFSEFGKLQYLCSLVCDSDRRSSRLEFDLQVLESCVSRLVVCVIRSPLVLESACLVLVESQSFVDSKLKGQVDCFCFSSVQAKYNRDGTSGGAGVRRVRCHAHHPQLLPEGEEHRLHPSPPGRPHLHRDAGDGHSERGVSTNKDQLCGAMLKTVDGEMKYKKRGRAVVH